MAIMLLAAVWPKIVQADPAEAELGSALPGQLDGLAGARQRVWGYAAPQPRAALRAVGLDRLVTFETDEPPLRARCYYSNLRWERTLDDRRRADVAELNRGAFGS
ncbi:hypothetical protein [Kitasatospora purpeofusca]|uniref:hypothetical protein n=1 Tax=Kitasatospora purpeofusca TaxID=67352 RepID=UPI0012FEFD1E|nr:hypothetical protein [Kitasatospora purpeofusca]